MKLCSCLRWILSVVAVSLFLCADSALATNRYVNILNPTPAAPFDSWATAATNIQNAIDASFPGDTVIVSNGVYQTGGRVIAESFTNRIAITQPITVQSVNGPLVTVIRGAYQSGGTNGNAAVRCVWMTNGSSLIGFTLTNGATRTAGVEQDGGGIWSQSTNTYISNCIITRCASDFRAGGVFQGSLYSCIITGNTSTATGSGSGGGGLYGAWADRCTIVNNRAIGGTTSSGGGGAKESTLNNCLIARNQATGGSGGGGAHDCSLYNCTVVNNFTDDDGGGALDSTIYNSIVYFNTAGGGGGGTRSNYYSCAFNDSCSAPTAGGITVIADPLLVDAAGSNYRLQTNSPCRDFGNNTYAPGATDLDNNSRVIGASVDMGAYESLMSPQGITLPPDNISYSGSQLRGSIIPGSLTAYGFFEFGTTTNYGTRYSTITIGPSTNDSTVGQNVTGLATGTMYHYRFAASNSLGVSYGSNITFFTLTFTNYVAITSTNPVPPYSSWTTAATNIQDAIDVAVVGATVLVSNGIYSTGGRTLPGLPETNRVLIDKAITVASVNGYQNTMIGGLISTIRAVYITNGATLVGFSLTNGFAQYGGGAYCETGAVLIACRISKNTAGQWGGGVYRGRLIDCLIDNNQAIGGGMAYVHGGGADSATLINCLLVNNTAGGVSVSEISGAGAHASLLVNCTVVSNRITGSGNYGGGVGRCTNINTIVYGNSTPSLNSNHFDSVFTYSCTAPLPSGSGNITNDPRFVDAGITNFYLLSDSPCIDSGNNADVVSTNDLGGNPRILNGVVDMGAFEFLADTDFDGIPNDWEILYGLDPNASNGPSANADDDWMTDLEEYIADTHPTNGASFFPKIILTDPPLGTMVLDVDPTSTARVYHVSWNTNLLELPQTWTLYPPEKTGTGSAISFTVTNEVPNRSFRTGVRLP